MSYDKSVFSSNLEYWLKRYSYSQKDLADAIGVTPTAVGDWVKGKKFPRIDKLQKIADHFRITVPQLIQSSNDIEVVDGRESIKKELYEYYDITEEAAELVMCYAEMLQGMGKYNRYAEED